MNGGSEGKKKNADTHPNIVSNNMYDMLTDKLVTFSFACEDEHWMRLDPIWLRCYTEVVLLS